LDGISYPVDTGFLVFNDWTYPNLISLFRNIEVETAPSEMSFSVKLTDPSGESKIEWSGESLATVFSQPSNLVRPRFWGMLRDIVRFNREATLLASSRSSMAGTVGQYLAANGYGNAFRNWYLAPMAACIWSTPTKKIDDFPLGTFLMFCHNHGLLSISNRPQWRTVAGGARTYARKLAASLPDIRLNAAVTRVMRSDKEIFITAGGQTEPFDQVVLACHTDQALRLLGDASETELRILSAIPYQPNVAVVHTDARLLPRRKRAWAAWNYQGEFTGTASEEARNDGAVSLSYLINRLQPLPFTSPVIVSMNPLFPPNPDTVIKTIHYDHPVFLPDSVVAKRGLRSLQGERRTWYAGAWTRYGFHEDGLMSGIAVAKALGATIPWHTDVPAANDLRTPYPGIDD
jgi:predicted NAD/FAD-binding protein